jgi:hypothetical protein|tara:strand:+ start:64 stop:570 length:507 start_codon:yes stop_codon:yes gene_type:complete
MKLIRLFFLSLILVSCSNNNQKKVKINYTIDYTELDNFIKDSLPVTLDLDSAYYQTFNKWKDISLINSVKKIPFVDSRQLSFPINLLKTDILKIIDTNVPFELDYPQIIGRFRVLKTDILKIDIDNLSIENFNIFQTHLRDIIVSYNAFVNTMNLEVTKDKSVDFSED